MVVAWSALSYALRGAPAGIPRRVLIPNTWDARGNWSVVRVRTLSSESRFVCKENILRGASIAASFPAGEWYQRTTRLLDLSAGTLCQIETGILSQTGS